MSGPKNRRLSAIKSNEISTTANTAQHLMRNDQQDGETSDSPLLTPSPPPHQSKCGPLERRAMFIVAKDRSKDLDETLTNINPEDGLAFLYMVNSSCQPLNDEPTSRDPMVETSSSCGSSSDTNEPVCTQLLTQLNTAYTHLAPDAQALFCNQDNGAGIPALTAGIQLVLPKAPKNYSFTNWNWPIIRKTFFWTVMSIFAGCIALAIGTIATMPKKCDPQMEWWQGSLFYEIFPASFQDSFNNDGIGDLRGVTDRLDYLEALGVRGIRLNSIFSSKEYPLNYMDVDSLTAIDPSLGSMSDFDEMIADVHQRKMSLILDLPLYPFVKNFGDEPIKQNFTRKYTTEEIITPLSSFLPDQETKEQMLSAQEQSDRLPPTIPVKNVVEKILKEHAVTEAIKFWRDRGVDGFYLKGLEHYLNETNFAAALRYWKSTIEPKRILMCSEEALNAAEGYSKTALLSRIDLVDVMIKVSNGTRSIKSQVSSVLKGVLFQKPGYPWVHWSVGSADTPRLASILSTANASVAVAIMGMMLPGTPNIFYGDEIGLLDSENVANHLTPMQWADQAKDVKTFEKSATMPWMKESHMLPDANFSALLSQMSKLRAETPTIFVKSILKNKSPVPNGDVRYSANEVIVIERWYPRRNTYVFVANLGLKTQVKDLSTLYYAGHVVIGPSQKVEQNIYFRQMIIPPGEALVIKLDK